MTIAAMPEFIDNRDGNTLLAALEIVIPDAPITEAAGPGDNRPAMAEICIATAFMSPAGFGAITKRLEQAGHVRLLIGAEPEPEARRPHRRPGDPPQATFERREVAEGLKLLEAGLRRERDRQPFTAEARRHLRGMAAMLRAGRLETRRYERAFLHAKAMLLDGLAPGLIAGSSNLTRAGLTENLELNLGRWDPGIFTQAKGWFETLWQEAVPFDLAALFEEPEAAFPPWLIFLRVLWQLYGEELEQEREEEGDIPLTAFQLHGVWRARRILQDYGGVVVADEVGLGKTFIAGEILNACAKNRQRALLVCPAALRDTTWAKFLLVRQRLRAALQADRKAITELPGRAGSGMRKGSRSGVLFCAEVELADGRRTFLRFVSATPAWKPKDEPGTILREMGTCLRLIDCEEDTPREMPGALADGVFAFWNIALQDILAEWDDLSDPANLQPSIRPLNRQIAAFIRAHPPHDMDQDRLSKALDVLEAPWPRREEMLLREQFRDRQSPTATRSLRLIDWILATGLERFEPPAPLPAIQASDVRLVCWMAVEAAANKVPQFR